MLFATEKFYLLWLLINQKGRDSYKREMGTTNINNTNIFILGVNFTFQSFI